MDFGKFWRVVEIENAIFRELECFGRREDF